MICGIGDTQTQVVGPTVECGFGQRHEYGTGKDTCVFDSSVALNSVLMGPALALRKLTGFPQDDVLTALLSYAFWGVGLYAVFSRK